MKRLLGQFLFVSGLLLPVFAVAEEPHAEAKLRTEKTELKLPLTGVTIPLSELTQFRDLSADEMIERIRSKYGVMIWIIDRRGVPGAKEVPPLRSKSEPGDKENLHYAKLMELPEFKNFGGSFLAPYHGPEGVVRPSEDKPSILLLRNYTDRATVIHEFVHYLIYLARKEERVELYGKKATVDSALKLFIDTEGRKLQAALDALEKEKDRAKQAELSDLIFKQVVGVANALSQQKAQRGFGEEADVTRTLVENADALGLVPEQVDRQLEYHRYAVDEGFKNLGQAMDLLASAQNRARSASQKQAFNGLVTQLNGLLSLYQAEDKWHGRAASKKSP